MRIYLPRVCHRVRFVPGLLALFHCAPVDLGSRRIPGASGRVVEVITWHGQSPCKASSRNVMVSASQKSGDRPRRVIMSSFGSSSDFWPLSLYRSSPSSLNSAGMCGPLGNVNGFRVVKPRAGSGSSRRANAAASGAQIGVPSPPGPRAEERFQPVRITPLQRSQRCPCRYCRCRRR